MREDFNSHKAKILTTLSIFMGCQGEVGREWVAIILINALIAISLFNLF